MTTKKSNSTLRSFEVTVKTDVATFRYPEIGSSSIAVHAHALVRFGLCGVTVIPKREKSPC